ncbi:MAG: hypothetical protein AMJ65_12625 [Phycisphaerae bacterium SG8_4]|nr:MAG: hypothetical protein AMJ65_12625 [Phycisphaerae bacterium SG8_4]
MVNKIPLDTFSGLSSTSSSPLIAARGKTFGIKQIRPQAGHLCTDCRSDAAHRDSHATSDVPDVYPSKWPFPHSADAEDSTIFKTTEVLILVWTMGFLPAGFTSNRR